jgi:hypothetical protein
MDKKIVQPLKDKFLGGAEVSGFSFEKVKESEHGYIYKVEGYDDNSYYEVFHKKTSPICIDFLNRVYSETDLKELYPKSNDFGVWAWTLGSYESAINKLNQIEHEKNKR